MQSPYDTTVVTQGEIQSEMQGPAQGRAEAPSGISLTTPGFGRRHRQSEGYGELLDDLVDDLDDH